MSKCGLCGVDFGSGSHMVIECTANMIPKSLYEKAAAWMANVDNPEDYYEDFNTGIGPSEELIPREEIILEAEACLKEEAFDIMYEIYQIYSESDGGRK